MLANAPFLLGDEPVYSDFALFGVLGNLVYKDWVEIPKELVQIKGWRERLRGFRYATVPAATSGVRI
jgi:glutathione S-transferase